MFLADYECQSSSAGKKDGSFQTYTDVTTQSECEAKCNLYDECQGYDFRADGDSKCRLYSNNDPRDTNNDRIWCVLKNLAGKFTYC